MATRSALPVSGPPRQGAEIERLPRVGDIYFSVDVETDGPIPGPYSMLSFGIALAGWFDGVTFRRPVSPATFYRELAPISSEFDEGALAVNGLDRSRLLTEGMAPKTAMREAEEWIASLRGSDEPVLVAYPASFDWTWIYWYFVRFLGSSPFNHSRCFDIKTAYAVKARVPVAAAGRAKMTAQLRPDLPHTHHALDDAIEQAEIFARLFEWGKTSDQSSE